MEGAPKEKIDVILGNKSFAEYMLAIIYTFNRKGECIIGAGKGRQSWQAQIIQMLRVFGVKENDKWSYKFGDGKEGLAVKLIALSLKED